METRLYRRQHEQLLAQLKALGALGPQTPGSTRRIECAKLCSLVKLYLGSLEGSLIPRLTVHERSTFRTLGAGLADDVRRFRSAVDTFSERWCRADAGSADAEGFIQAYETMADALRDRIERDRTEFFDRIDLESRRLSEAPR